MSEDRPHYSPNAISRRLEPAVRWARGDGTPRAAKIADWLRRRYLWVVIPAALVAYIAAWVLVTGQLPGLVRTMLGLLDSHLDRGAEVETEDIRNLAYAIAALFGATVVLATIPFGLIKTWINERQATTAEQGHITDRLTKAIEMLGAEKTTRRTETYRVRTIEYDMPAGERSHAVEFRHREGDDFTIPPDVPDDAVRFGNWETITSTTEQTVPNLEVRLGAIYALERIAQDSERDHITVMETLCAYIRENAPASGAKDHDLGEWTGRAEGEDAGAPVARLEELEKRSRDLWDWALALPPPRVDIQAGLSVIGRRGSRRVAHERRQRRSAAADDPGFQLDLRETCLQGVDLGHAELDHAILAGARLESAFLTGAKLRRANLAGARLHCANLRAAQLDQATLDGSNLEQADLGQAGLKAASLFGASMARANLSEADMSRGNLARASLDGADLGRVTADGANLGGARMECADLSGARFREASLSRTRLVSADLRGWLVTRASLGRADLSGATDLDPASLNDAFGDGSTVLPAGVSAPDHWPDDALDWDAHETAYRAWLDAGAPPGKPRETAED